MFKSRLNSYFDIGDSSSERKAQFIESFEEYIMDLENVKVCCALIHFDAFQDNAR
jgi:hypothetical protein